MPDYIRIWTDRWVPNYPSVDSNVEAIYSVIAPSWAVVSVSQYVISIHDINDSSALIAEIQNLWFSGDNFSAKT